MGAHMTTGRPTFAPSPALRALRCIQCAATYPVGDGAPDLPRGCPSCDAAGRGANLRCVYDASVTRPADLTPYPRVPDLGQGATPLLPLPWWEDVLVKNEAANPTGSHKDRFAAVAVAHAAARGYRRVVIGSSGNAGIALAAYAASVGLECEVAGFSWLPQAARELLTALGARVRTFDEDRDRIRHVEESADDPGALTVSNVADPVVGSNCFGIEGYKDIAREIAERVPDGVDHVVVPSSRGDLAWGIHRGFVELAELRGHPLPRMHLTEPFPRLSAVLDGVPVTGRFPGDAGRLSSIAGDSATVQALLTVEGSGGTATVVTDPQAEVWYQRLLRRGHVWERSSGTVFAAYERLLRDGVVRPGQRTVLIATSHLFKGF